MIKYEGLQAVIGTAIVDARFRAQLLQGATNVASDFGLSPEECAILSGIRSDTLHGFAHEVQLWLNRQAAPSAETLVV